MGSRKELDNEEQLLWQVSVDPLQESLPELLLQLGRRTGPHPGEGLLRTHPVFFWLFRRRGFVIVNGLIFKRPLFRLRERDRNDLDRTYQKTISLVERAALPYAYRCWTSELVSDWPHAPPLF